MVNVGKREDGLLDYVNQMKGRIDFALMQIELYIESESEPVTEREREMLEAIRGHLAVKEESE